MGTVLKFLVSGATGFIGFHVVRELRGRGFPVEALARPASDLRSLQALGVPVRVADWGDSEAAARGLAGAHVLIHLAGLTKARREIEFRQANGDLVASLANGARREGLSRFLLVSSLAAAGPGTAERPRRETDVCEPVTAYGRSKLLGEQVLKAAAGEMPWTIVRPPVVYGPGDRDVLQMFKMADLGIVPVVGMGNRRVSVIYGPDLARHLVDLALHELAVGRTFHVAEATHYSWTEFAREISRAVGRRAWIMRPPSIFAAGSALGGSLMATIRRKPSLVSWSKLPEILAAGWVADVAQAAECLPDLGATALPEGAAETALWYRAQGWLAPVRAPR